jgi:hypothetical protein
VTRRKAAENRSLIVNGFAAKHGARLVIRRTSRRLSSAVEQRFCNALRRVMACIAPYDLLGLLRGERHPPVHPIRTRPEQFRANLRANEAYSPSEWQLGWLHDDICVPPLPSERSEEK